MAQGTFDVAAMKKAAGDFGNYSQEYRSISKQLMSVATTMGSAWKDDATQTYISSIQSLSSELDAMANKLQAGSDALNQQAQAYEKNVGSILESIPKN